MSHATITFWVVLPFLPSHQTHVPSNGSINSYGVRYNNKNPKHRYKNKNPKNTDTKKKKKPKRLIQQQKPKSDYRCSVGFQGFFLTYFLSKQTVNIKRKLSQMQRKERVLNTYQQRAERTTGRTTETVAEGKGDVRDSRI